MRFFILQKLNRIRKFAEGFILINLHPTFALNINKFAELIHKVEHRNEHL